MRDEYEFEDLGIPTTAAEHEWLGRLNQAGVFPVSMDEDTRETFMLWALIRHKIRRWHRVARWLRPSLLIRVRVALRLILLDLGAWQKRRGRP